MTGSHICPVPRRLFGERETEGPRTRHILTGYHPEVHCGLLGGHDSVDGWGHFGTDRVRSAGVAPQVGQRSASTGSNGETVTARLGASWQ